MKSEKDLQNFLQSECFKRDILFYKFSSPARRGVPDVILINPKCERYKVHFVELKSPTGKGKLHPLQVHEIGKLRMAGVPVYVVATMIEVENLIATLNTPCDG
jgi:hypothetical protein